MAEATLLSLKRPNAAQGANNRFFQSRCCAWYFRRCQHRIRIRAELSVMYCYVPCNAIVSSNDDMSAAASQRQVTFLVCGDAILEMRLMS